jgi:hypothetical protein
MTWTASSVFSLNRISNEVNNPLTAPNSTGDGDALSLVAGAFIYTRTSTITS